MIEWLEVNSELAVAITALGALATSVVSAILGAYAMMTQRKHNRKSIAPYAELTIADYENRIKVALKNVGPGTLIVEDFKAYSQAKISNDLVSLMPNLPDGMAWTTYTGSLSDRCLSPEEERVVLQLDGDENDENFIQFRDCVRRELSDLTIKVFYKDMYGLSHPSRSRTLEWFARNLK